MHDATESTIALLLACAGLLGCGGAQSPPRSPTEAEPAPPPAAEPAPGPAEGAPARPDLTAAACEAGGGTVVGDIGDGAIHRADYRCPSGGAPTGNIRGPEGGPMGVEGSVCCPK